jgi:hypothetical protein
MIEKYLTKGNIAKGLEIISLGRLLLDIIIIIEVQRLTGKLLLPKVLLAKDI